MNLTITRKCLYEWTEKPDETEMRGLRGLLGSPLQAPVGSRPRAWAAGGARSECW